MKSYFAFTKKEWMEGLRTYKIMIMFIVFLLLGIMNPITAKMTPQLIKEFMPKGMQITIAEPTALDSWTQFYKNVPQMGLIVLVILFSGMIANEFTHGTLINMLTKGLNRSVVILSKFTMAVFVWTLSFWMCFGVTYAYTLYFWDTKGISHLLFSSFCIWLFGVLLISATLLGGVIIGSSYGSLLFTGAFVVLLFLLNIVPTLQEYNPIRLISNNMNLLTTTLTVREVFASCIVCCFITIGFVFTSMVTFNKKQI